MSVTFIPAEQLAVFEGQRVAPEAGGAVRSLEGNQGVVFYGPYIPVAAGVYRVTARAKVFGPEGARAYFDVDADWRLRANRHFSDGVTLFPHLYRTDRLEFRFATSGEELLVEGVEIEPLLLDEEPTVVEAVRALAERLIDERGEPDAIFRLINRLATANEVAQAEALRERFVGRAIDPLRRAFMELNQPGVKSLTPLPQACTREEIGAMLGGLPLQSFDMLNVSAETKAELARQGYELDYIQATRLYRAYDEPMRTWRSEPDHTLSAGEFTSRPPLFERFAEMDRSFQWELARGEGMSAYCPISGRLLKSQHGFCQHYGSHPFLFYRFDGLEVFYICTGHVSNARMFMYLPRTGTIADLRDPWLRQYSNEHVLGMFNTNLVAQRDEVVRYLNSPTRPAAVLGSNIHGHFIWTSLSGLHFASGAGLLDDIAEVVELDRYYFSAQELFPEIADKPRARFRNNDSDALAFAHCLRRNLLPIHFTDAFVIQSFAERFRRQAALHASSAGQVPSNVPRPLLFINLRAHNKVWINQAEGYAQILNSIYAEYGAAAAFLDGMPDCSEIAVQIRKYTRPEVPLYDGLEVSIHDTMSWAFAADAYVSPIGSGITLVNWLANKSGVAHAEHGHLEQMIWWNTLRPGLVDPVTPDFSQIVNVGEGLYCDYDVDWRVLLELLRPTLDASFARRSEQPRAGGR